MQYRYEVYVEVAVWLIFMLQSSLTSNILDLWGGIGTILADQLYQDYSTTVVHC